MSHHASGFLTLWLLSLLFVPLACRPACGETSTGAPAPGTPVGYWSFDKGDVIEYKALDKSGNGHDGVIDGAAPVAGRVGQALKFDGSAGSVTIDGLDVKSKQLSVSLWLRKEPGKERVNRLIFLGDFLQIGFFDDMIFVHTGRVTKADVNKPHAAFGLTPGQWHNLVVTWDTAAPNDNVKVYLDGALRLAADLQNALNVSLEPARLVIASNGQPDSKQGFVGVLDEVALYDTALTASKIKAYFNRVVKRPGGGASDSDETGKVIRFPREPEELYVPKETYAGPRKLIRVGSELCSRLLDSPSIAEADLPAKVKAWQDRGLDGVVFSMASHSPDKPEKNMSGQWWSLVPHEYDELALEIQAFQSVKDWGRLTDNFLWSSMAVWGGSPKGQDWFSDEDWDIILANVRLQAQVAKECGFKGILLDAEQYPDHHAKGPWRMPFSYPLYAESGYQLAGEDAPRPFAEVAAKIRQRGSQYAQAVCGAFPGVRIMVIPGLYEWTKRLGSGPLEKNEEGLYPSFLNGLLEGLDDQASVIGGSELTYDKSSLMDVMRARKWHDEAMDELCDAPASAKGKMSFAAGIWADAGRSWSDTDAGKNARTPEELKQALQNAFKASGEYAWLYGEKSRFLTTEPTSLLRAYFQANVDAHQGEE
ncbi:MAG: LamG domain-containing protein [Planctomycetota bacterium]